MVKPTWSREEIIEGSLVFLLLLPFYLFMLPAPGPIKAFGFCYLAGIVGYMLFLTPHRVATPYGRRTLMEVFGILVWSMVVIWGILPAGPWGKFLGQILIGGTVIYILFFARKANGDTLEDWGIGSAATFWEYLKHGEKRYLAWAGFILANLLLILGCFFARDILNGILSGVLRRSFGIRFHQEIPFAILLSGSLFLMNFILIAVVRYDNIVQAAKIIAIYLLGLLILVSVAGYIYIYLMNQGYVEIVPHKGLVGIGAYVLWGTLQELLFLSYFNTRIRKGISSPLLSALLTAVVFSIYHLTAYTLMFLCFLVGIIWALIFQAAPNLFVLGVSHGISGGFGSIFQVHGMTIFKIKGSVGPFNM